MIDDEGQKYWGKYRGTVIDTVDLTQTGRLLCVVPALPGMVLNWALPCVPYAGLEEGFFALPPEGGNVWIEFERGNPDYPIWSGCFWEEAEVPIMPELSPEAPELIKVFRSKFCTIVMNDTPGEGGITITADPEAVEPPVLMTITSEGMQVTIGETILLINAETGITLTAAETVVSVSPEAVSVESELVDMTAETINVTGETNVEGETNVVGEMSVEGETTITPALAVEGTAEISGVTEIAAELNVTGAVTVEGETNVVGAVTVEGETNVAGALTVEGDVNVAGGQQIEGELAVAGVILGIVVPPGL
jgi:hypothetical protein